MTTAFVNGLFEKLFFGGDKAAGVAAFESDIAPDAVFDFNGKITTRAEFFAIIERIHSTSTVKLISVEDLAVRDNVVAQVSKSTHTTDGVTKEQTGVRIVKVEERGGKKVLTSLVVVQA